MTNDSARCALESIDPEALTRVVGGIEMDHGPESNFDMSGMDMSSGSSFGRSNGGLGAGMDTRSALDLGGNLGSGTTAPDPSSGLDNLGSTGSWI
jgi:hypothetical protein